MSVLVVEDDVRLHGIFAQLLEGEEHALTFATSAAAALEQLGASRPSVLLVDLGLPDGDGVDLIAEVRRLQPDVACLVVTSASTRAHVLSALRAGACGYLLKEELATRLVTALREVLSGGMPMSPDAARYVLERFRLDAPAGLAKAPTPRERELLEMLARGLTYAQVASELHVSINTVRTHVRSAYEKLQAANKAEAIMFALREGWIDR